MKRADTGDYELGMVGLGTMGSSLLLNIADKGFMIAGYDTDKNKVKSLLKKGHANVTASDDLEIFISKLKQPRIIVMLVPAGFIVDEVIDKIAPLLEADDLLLDCGNSYFRDTDRRAEVLKQKKIHYMGVGISGGEDGARYGPSIMPGGDTKDYERIRKVCESIAAKAKGEPCVTLTGKGSAGHFVKMVHNGIEYAIMQLIAEAYDLLRKGAMLNNNEIHSLFTEWNTTQLNSYLIEITGIILNKKDLDGQSSLLDQILDAARQKGTGMWTTQTAMELQIPVPTIDIAVSVRDLSTHISDRHVLSKIIKYNPAGYSIDKDTFPDDVRNALYCGILLAYSQGFMLLEAASAKYKYSIPLSAIARIWRGGCIIRSAILDEISRILSESESGNLMADLFYSREITNNQESLRKIVSIAAMAGIPAPAIMTSLGYLDSFRSEKLPTSLIQAQRDFFGAHTYERTDVEGVFHTQWSE
jgi:6-phosphogluconate dehydrogenase